MKLTIEDSRHDDSACPPAFECSTGIDADQEKRQAAERASYQRWELFMRLIEKYGPALSEEIVIEQERLSRVAMERFMEAR